MVSNENITILSVSDIQIKKTINAIIKSSFSLRPSENILFTSKKINLTKQEKKYIKLINIKPIVSLKDYSNFIIYELHKYITTTHALIVQWDGQVFNPEGWDLSFLDYDYIGAPFIPRHFDECYSRDKKGNFYVVGNGGFSLRSKKLLEAPCKFKLKNEYSYTKNHEDGFFSVLHREFLESKGFKWAPYDIARKFCIESPLSLSDLKKRPLGFHGKKMYYLNLLLNIGKKIF